MSPRTIVVAIAMLMLAGCSEPPGEQKSRADWIGAEGAGAEVNDAYAGPLTVHLECTGRFSTGWSWTLDVGADGKAHLSIETFPERSTRFFSVPRAELEAFRTLLAEERFLDLRDRYGQTVPDGSTRTIAVQCGGRDKSVQLRFFGNWINSDPAKLVEPARAIRVWTHARQWFQDPEAVDLSEYDGLVLRAASRN